jgi:hypothetical protein
LKSDCDTVAAQAGCYFIGDRNGRYLKSSVFFGYAHVFQGCAIAIEFPCILLSLHPPKQALKPTAAPMQLSKNGLKVDTGMRNKIKRHDAMEAPANIDRVRDMNL